MRFLIILFLLTIFQQLKAQQIMNTTGIQKIISNIEHTYAPDNRTVLFNISYKQTFGTKVSLSGETSSEIAKTELLNDLQKNQYKYIDSIVVLPEKKLGDKIYGLIDVSVASLRTKPEQAAELATQALLGSRVKILKELRSWDLVQTPDKYIAWMESGNLEKLNKSQLNNWDSSKRIIYTKEYGTCFSKEDVHSIPVSDLVAGNLFKEINRDNNFVKVEFPDKRIGYIPDNECEDFNSWLNTRHINAENIISTAKKLMGTPYLWGGTSTKLMDCSGFTRTVFFLNGILLPRDASQQVNVGLAVDTKNGFSNLKPGDLLFFGEKATAKTKEKVSHVAIYLGNEEFIHESEMVRVNSFDVNRKNFSLDRLTQFIRAKRIIDSVGKNKVELLKDIDY